MDNTSFNGENQASMPMQPITQGAPKKQGGKTVIIAIIALLVGAAIASAIFICLNGGFDFGKKGGSKTNEQQSSKEEQDAEATITDEKTIKELAEKTNIILARGYDKTSDKKITTWDFTYSLESFSTLKTSEKMGDIVRLFAWDNNDVQPMTKEQFSKLTSAEIQTLKDDCGWDRPTTDGLKDVYLVLKNNADVKKKYQYVFGETLDKMPEKADGAHVACGNYIYLSSIDSFVAGNGCGDLGASRLIFKQLSYKQTDSKAYVEFIVDITVPDASSVGSSDASTDKHCVNFSCSKTIDAKTEAFSDESTYVKYRAVFDKQDDGNYAYKTIEEVKD